MEKKIIMVKDVKTIKVFKHIKKNRRRKKLLQNMVKKDEEDHKCQLW